MNLLIRTVKLLRSHWKKTAFASVLGIYGIDYTKKKIEVQEMMRAYCEESKRFGDATLPGGTKLRHVTVVLNPAAKNGKGVALFEKFVAPLLHLAGIRVSIVKTEQEGEVKSLMQIMDNTDAVLVAGGDGTLLEAVTGLCRRTDADIAALKIPIGIIPIGRTNSIARKLLWGSHLQEAKLLAESVMVVIRGNTRAMNVMAIETELGKSIFALSSFEWGIYRDVNSKIQNYWYLGPFKAKAAYVFASFKRMMPTFKAELLWTPPCDGCSKCYKPSVIATTNKYSAPDARRWWHSFIPRNPRTDSVTTGTDYSKISNENCGYWNSVTVSATDLQIVTENVLPNCQALDGNATSLKIKIGFKWQGRLDFVHEGWRRVSNDDNESGKWQQIIAAREVKIEPNVSEVTESWFSIDNEDFEAKPVHLELQRRKIYMFCK